MTPSSPLLSHTNTYLTRLLVLSVMSAVNMTLKYELRAQSATLWQYGKLPEEKLPTAERCLWTGPQSRSLSGHSAPPQGGSRHWNRKHRDPVVVCMWQDKVWHSAETTKLNKAPCPNGRDRFGFLSFFLTIYLLVFTFATSTRWIHYEISRKEKK